MEGGDVLEAGGEFEAGVQVDADALWVVEGVNALRIVRPNASTQQEGCLTVIVCKHIPVKL